jgi:dienelactone hydrolase
MSTTAVAAAQYLVERGDVDPDRLAIEGGSAGGYTTLAALAFRDVFAAGISLFGIGDLELLDTDSHKFESHYNVRLVGAVPGGGLPLLRALAQSTSLTASRPPS